MGKKRKEKTGQVNECWIEMGIEHRWDNLNQTKLLGLVAVVVMVVMMMVKMENGLFRNIRNEEEKER